MERAAARARAAVKFRPGDLCCAVDVTKACWLDPCDLTGTSRLMFHDEVIAVISRLNVDVYLVLDDTGKLWEAYVTFIKLVA